MPNDFTRNPLAIGPTVSPQSNYIAKPEERIFVENDKRLALARSLQAYNPRLKDWADNYEQKLIEEGRAEAMRIFEAEGKDGILKEKAAAAERENPILICANPYTKRFLDRYKAEQLSVQKYAFMTLELEKQGAYNESDPEKMMSAINDLSRQYDDKHADELSKMDTRELDAVYHDASRKLPDMLMSEYRKYQAERLKESRGAIVDKKLDEITNANIFDAQFLREIENSAEAIFENEQPEEGKIYSSGDGRTIKITKVGPEENGRKVSYYAYLDKETGKITSVERMAVDESGAINLEALSRSGYMTRMRKVYHEILESGVSTTEFKKRYIEHVNRAIMDHPEMVNTYAKVAAAVLGELKWEQGYTYGDNAVGTPLASNAEIGALRNVFEDTAYGAIKTRNEMETLNKKKAKESLAEFLFLHAYDDELFNLPPLEIMKKLGIDLSVGRDATEIIGSIQRMRDGEITRGQGLEFARMHDEINSGIKITIEEISDKVLDGELHITHANALVSYMKEWDNSGKKVKMNYDLAGAYENINDRVSNGEIDGNAAVRIKTAMREQYRKMFDNGTLPNDGVEQFFLDQSEQLMSPKSPYMLSGQETRRRNNPIQFNSSHIEDTLNKTFLEIEETVNGQSSRRSLRSSSEYAEKIKELEKYKEPEVFREFLEYNGMFGYSTEEASEIYNNLKTEMQKREKIYRTTEKRKKLENKNKELESLTLNPSDLTEEQKSVLGEDFISNHNRAIIEIIKHNRELLEEL